ncbi:MAG: hypothetical protein NTW85_05985 [Methylococcales bacterium]|nr:hypothetical protein [Methylococcales bacterium]
MMVFLFEGVFFISALGVEILSILMITQANLLEGDVLLAALLLHIQCFQYRLVTI